MACPRCGGSDVFAEAEHPITLLAVVRTLGVWLPLVWVWRRVVRRDAHRRVACARCGYEWRS